ncbi:MAG: CHRD domain-containing protein [bacterium]|nr:CHRD domain-containing protein [bacterium]
MIKNAVLFVLLFVVIVLGGSILAQDHGGMVTGGEIDRPSPIPLNPAGGSEIGFVYEAYLSPHQEGGEEEDTPGFVPPQFRSTAPSVPRDQRTSMGHGVIEFTNDLSKAYVHLAIANVNLADITMLHLHCGRPGQLGPIIVDFGMKGSFTDLFADGVMTVEITNADIEAVTANPNPNPIEAFTLGCPITTSNPTDKVKTIAGLQLIAEQGEIYFNLHTAGQNYFGDIRGQVHEVDIND